MRKTLSVAVLLLALCGPAAAGIIQNGQPAAASDGIIHTGQPSAASDGIIQGGQPAAAGDGIIQGGKPSANGEIPNDVAGALTQLVLTALSVLP